MEKYKKKMLEYIFAPEAGKKWVISERQVQKLCDDNRIHKSVEIMENVIMQISECISVNQNACIECEDEGELYRLFHEVNSLVSI